MIPFVNNALSTAVVFAFVTFGHWKYGRQSLKHGRTKIANYGTLHLKSRWQSLAIWFKSPGRGAWPVDKILWQNECLQQFFLSHNCNSPCDSRVCICPFQTQLSSAVIIKMTGQNRKSQWWWPNWSWHSACWEQGSMSFRCFKGASTSEHYNLPWWWSDSDCIQMHWINFGITFSPLFPLCKQYIFLRGLYLSYCSPLVRPFLRNFSVYF